MIYLFRLLTSVYIRGLLQAYWLTSVPRVGELLPLAFFPFALPVFLLPFVLTVSAPFSFGRSCLPSQNGNGRVTGVLGFAVLND